MLYLITLENTGETRYSNQWRKWIPEELKKRNIIYYEINGVSDAFISGNNFLNPNSTNIWKSEQIIEISKLFSDGKIKKNDKFLFYDAWHYGIIALKYMSILNDIPIKIYGIFHAGSYDMNDLLGQKDKDNKLLTFEKSLFEILDKSFVATDYHRNLILNCFQPNKFNIKVTGLPYKFSDLDKWKIDPKKKENIVIFPHRLSVEKRPKFLKKIKKYIQGDVIFCQEKNLSKDEYHNLLAKSKIVFSANLQETWGIGVFEAMYLGCIPVLPDRLSYSEMYDSDFLYPKSYEKNNIFLLIDRINYILINYEKYTEQILKNIEKLKMDYCTFEKILEEIED